jgi:hypothetical protein
VRHPAYAGAYGYRQTDPRRKTLERPSSGQFSRRPEECHVSIRDRVPPYISWDRFLANQERSRTNRNQPGSPGALRNGAALLGGLVLCGRCGRRMAVCSCGPKSRPWYACSSGLAEYAEPLCQSAHGVVLDEVVASQILPWSLRLPWRRSLRQWLRMGCLSVRRDGDGKPKQVTTST